MRERERERERVRERENGEKKLNFDFFKLKILVKNDNNQILYSIFNSYLSHRIINSFPRVNKTGITIL